MGQLPIHATLIAGAFVVIPFLWMLTLSLAGGAHPPALYLIPRTSRWPTTTSVAGRAIRALLLNSMVMTAGLCLGRCFCPRWQLTPSPVSFPGRDALFLVFLATMMVLFYVTLILRT